MRYKINNKTREVSEYTESGRLSRSIECRSLVVELDGIVSSISDGGNARKREGISTCHAFLSGKQIRCNKSSPEPAFIKHCKHDQISYDVESKRFMCQSGRPLSESDHVIFYPQDKRCYVLRYND